MHSHTTNSRKLALVKLNCPHHKGETSDVGNSIHDKCLEYLLLVQKDQCQSKVTYGCMVFLQGNHNQRESNAKS